MKLWNLDNGSIVIDHAQLMWNIGGGTPVRIPSYGILIEHDEGLFLIDTGFDLEHTTWAQARLLAQGILRIIPFLCAGSFHAISHPADAHPRPPWRSW